jgi:thiol-disulfide isomerase/thioredoxin
MQSRSGKKNLMTDQTRIPESSSGSGSWYYLFVFSIPVLVVLALVAMGLISSNFGPRPMSGMGGLAPGGTLPAIQADGWVNGAPPADAELKGKVVVIEAWATWCGPCREQAPHMVQLYRDYKDRGVVFIGLTSEGSEDVRKIQRFVEHFEIDWPNGYGAEKLLRQIGANYIPRVWVVGPDGKVVWNTDSEGTPIDGIEQALAQLPKSSR